MELAQGIPTQRPKTAIYQKFLSQSFPIGLTTTHPILYQHFIYETRHEAYNIIHYPADGNTFTNAAKP